MSSASVWYFCRTIMQENDIIYKKKKINLLSKLIKKIDCDYFQENSHYFETQNHTSFYNNTHI